MARVGGGQLGLTGPSRVPGILQGRGLLGFGLRLRLGLRMLGLGLGLRLGIKGLGITVK